MARKHTLEFEMFMFVNDVAEIDGYLGMRIGRHA